jgi:hypothetical protein
MFRMLSFILVLVMLVGCATVPKSIPISAGQTTVVICTPPPEIVKPTLALSLLTPETLAPLSQQEVRVKVLQTYVITVAQLMEFSEYLLTIVEGYKVKQVEH